MKYKWRPIFASLYNEFKKRIRFRTSRNDDTGMKVDSAVFLEIFERHQNNKANQEMVPSALGGLSRTQYVFVWVLF